MFKLFALTLLTISSQGLADSVTDGAKLISTIIVHRHGDRTPVPSSVSLTTDVEAVEAASAVYGYGQLTNLGKQRAYSLGETLRARYNELLSPQYNSSEIYVRSTDSTRAKMTILTALAAIYPAYPGSWSDTVNWTPVPYHTLGIKYDFNLFYLNCPNFLTSYADLAASNPARMNKYFNALNTVASVLGYNLTSTPANGAYSIYDALISQEHLGVPLPEEIAAILPDLKDAAGVAAEILYGNDNNLAYEGGPLLTEFFTQADNLISGTDTPRVRIYSAHDLNVYAFQAASKVYPREESPPYASVYGIELRQVESTGEYVVLPVYQSSPGEGWTYKTPAGCDTLCPYDTYKQLVSDVTLDEDTWRTKCGFDAAIVIDDSGIN